MKSSSEQEKIAFVGLGKMGAAMAANVRRAGHPLVVWNRSSDKASPLLELGATLAKSPAAAVADADIVISSLADDGSVRAVVSGPDGILAGMRPGAVHIGTSTISPALSDELGETHAAAGRCYIAGPVVGRVPAAVAAQLMTFVAGDAESDRGLAIRHRGLCADDIRCRRPSRSGVDRQAHRQFSRRLGPGSDRSVLGVGGEVGLVGDLVQQMLSGFFANPATREYVTKIRERDFETVGFTAAGGLKDVKLMIAAAQDVKLRLSSAEALRNKLEAAIARGWQDKDWSCLTDIDRG